MLQEMLADAAGILRHVETWENFTTLACVIDCRLGGNVGICLRLSLSTGERIPAYYVVLVLRSVSGDGRLSCAGWRCREQWLLCDSCCLNLGRIAATRTQRRWTTGAPQSQQACCTSPELGVRLLSHFGDGILPFDVYPG